MGRSLESSQLFILEFRESSDGEARSYDSLTRSDYSDFGEKGEFDENDDYDLSDVDNDY